MGHEYQELVGFTAGGDGVLRAPAGSVVTLTPVDGHFYRLAIALPHGAVVSCHVARNALKVTAPEIEKIDIDGLMNVARRRPW